jgi:hypothetical protein
MKQESDLLKRALNQTPQQSNNNTSRDTPQQPKPYEKTAPKLTNANQMQTPVTSDLEHASPLAKSDLQQTHHQLNNNNITQKRNLNLQQTPQQIKPNLVQTPHQLVKASDIEAPLTSTPLINGSRSKIDSMLKTDNNCSIPSTSIKAASNMESMLKPANCSSNSANLTSSMDYLTPAPRSLRKLNPNQTRQHLTNMSDTEPPLTFTPMANITHSTFETDSSCFKASPFKMDSTLEADKSSLYLASQTEDSQLASRPRNKSILSSGVKDRSATSKKRVSFSTGENHMLNDRQISPTKRIRLDFGDDGGGGGDGDQSNTVAAAFNSSSSANKAQV